jgi:hypothetical protein
VRVILGGDVPVIFAVLRGSVLAGQVFVKKLIENPSKKKAPRGKPSQARRPEVNDDVVLSCSSFPVRGSLLERGCSPVDRFPWNLLPVIALQQVEHPFQPQDRAPRMNDKVAMDTVMQL